VNVKKKHPEKWLGFDKPTDQLSLTKINFRECLNINYLDRATYIKQFGDIVITLM
jgi:ssRNA-specific RNase YbeY (16S rRNA maturation enzyme)